MIAGELIDMGIGENEENAVPPPVRRKRGRKPRRIIAWDAAGKPVYYTALTVQLEYIDPLCVLRLAGKLETEAVIALRDHAFTAIGELPDEICLDLCDIALPLDRHSMDTLFTIGRVARLMGVRYSVILPSPLEAVWHETGLHRHIPIQSDPRFLHPTVRRPNEDAEDPPGDVKAPRGPGVFIGGV